MFDFKFTLNHVLTIVSIVITFVWTTSQIVGRFERLEKDTTVALDIARDNNDRLTKIETMLVSDIASLKKLIRNQK